MNLEAIDCKKFTKFTNTLKVDKDKLVYLDQHRVYRGNQRLNDIFSYSFIISCVLVSRLQP